MKSKNKLADVLPQTLSDIVGQARGGGLLAPALSTNTSGGEGPSDCST